MRLGLNWRPVATDADLTAALDLCDDLGIGAVAAPAAVGDWSLAECRAYGEAVRERGLIVGELGYWENLLAPDGATRTDRVEDVRDLLRRADAMGADCVVTLVGSRSPEWAGAPHPDNYGEGFRSDVRETVARVLDGLELERTRYVLEPWYNTFFHRPRPVRAFLDAVDDDRLGVHMDAMNMHTVETAHRSTTVIDRAFDLLAEDAAAVHVKDLALVAGEGRDVCTLREVPPGAGDEAAEGCLDLARYVERLDDLDEDVAVYTEHWEDDATYEAAIEHLRGIADRVGTTVVGRGGEAV
jgi:sugar phosphate isomerase/epimerase